MLTLIQVAKDNLVRKSYQFSHFIVGNVFVNVKKDKKGRPTGKPELILLDHGLYKELSEDLKVAYSYLWKGIMIQDEQMMKESSMNLGVRV